MSFAQKLSWALGAEKSFSRALSVQDPAKYSEDLLAFEFLLDLLLAFLTV